MIHLVTSLVRADARSAPGRVVATTGLLTAAGLFGVAGTTGPLLTALLAGAIAGAAALGVVAGHRRRSEVLAGNGAGPGVETAVAAASIVGPALVAAALTLVAAGLADAATSVVGVLVTTVVVPAPRRDRGRVAGHVRHPATPLPAPPLAGTPRSGRRGRVPHHRPPRPGRRRGVADGTVRSGRRRARRRRRSSAGWRSSPGRPAAGTSLGLVLLLFGPPAVGAVAVLGIAGLRVAAAGLGRLGSVGRLASASLVHQRRVLGPLVGVVAVVTSLAALDATVGASFGQREADREETRPTITAPVGHDRPPGPRRPPPRRRRRGPPSRRRGRRRIGHPRGVIDQVGAGGAPMDPTAPSTRTSSTSRCPRLSGSGRTPRRPCGWGWSLPTTSPRSASSAYADDLSAGRAVVLNPAATSDPAGDHDRHRRRVVTRYRRPWRTCPESASASRPQWCRSRWPRCSVSPSRPAAWWWCRTRRPPRGRRPPCRWPAGSGPRRRTSPSSRSWRTTTSPPSRPPSERTGWSSAAGRRSSSSRAVRSTRCRRLADSAEQGRSRLTTWGALALLVTVAAVVLALGATRADDAVLDLQGARPGSGPPSAPCRPR